MGAPLAGSAPPPTLDATGGSPTVGGGGRLAEDQEGADPTRKRRPEPGDPEYGTDAEVRDRAMELIGTRMQLRQLGNKAWAGQTTDEPAILDAMAEIRRRRASALAQAGKTGAGGGT